MASSKNRTEKWKNIRSCVAVYFILSQYCRSNQRNQLCVRVFIAIFVQPWTYWHFSFNNFFFFCNYLHLKIIIKKNRLWKKYCLVARADLFRKKYVVSALNCVPRSEMNNILYSRFLYKNINEYVLALFVCTL